MGRGLLLLWLLLATAVWGQSVPTRPVGETVEVRAFRITGNTLIPSERLQAAVQPYLGQELSLDDLKAAAAAITALYHQEGYLLVRALVPPQAYKDGQVDLLVLEGKLGTITVEGNEEYSSEFIRDHFAHDREFHAESFQRALLLLNEYPDLKVRSILRAGQEPGTADVVLSVQDSLPVHGGVDFNNFGSLATGTNRMGLNFDAANLAFEGDKVTLRAVLGFPSVQNNFYQVNYVTPVDYDGTRVGFAYATGASIVGRELEILDFRNRANIFTVSASRALTRSLTRSSDVFLNLSTSDIYNTVLGEPFNRDHYYAARLGYSQDRRDPDGRTWFRGVVSQGLGGLNDCTTVSRLGAEGTFTKLNLDLARVQTLAPGFYGVLRGSGQLARTPLISAEQFVLGGPDSVRGYPQGQLLGDSAYLASLELRWALIEGNPDGFQLVSFIEHGTVYRNFLLPDEFERQSLTGAGFGFRASPWKNTFLRVDVGFPVTPAQSSSGLNPAVYTQFSTRY